MKYDIFLGGSCNPTTWRRDIVIPILKKKKITFYNPQVAHWDKSLIQLESEAKKNADILFFVFDRSTRNIVSMGEVAFLAAANRRIIVVLENFSGPPHPINGYPISADEHDELSFSLRMVRHLSEKHAVPVFSQITHAVTCAEKILKGNVWPHYKFSWDHDDDDGVPETNGVHSVPTISMKEAISVFKVITNRPVAEDELKLLYFDKTGTSLKSAHESSSQLDNPQLTFEEFCCVVDEFEGRCINKQTLWYLLVHSDLRPIQKYIDWVVPKFRTQPFTMRKFPSVYLGGSTSEVNNWRTDIAIPLLQKYRLTFLIPSTVSSTDEPLPLADSSCIENSQVLLFVITNSSRDCCTMVLANYAIGLKKQVVLCIQMIPPESPFNTDTQLQDYNRGRAYLKDQARNEGIPVYTDIKSAVEAAISKCV